MHIAAFVAIGYLFGSLPTAYIAGKLNGIDIREHGSGNVGATNTLRVLGKKWGIAVLLIDALKGYLPVFFVSLAVPEDAAVSGVMQIHIMMMAGVSAMLGHIYPVWLGFKGGKGVATGLGLMTGLVPPLIGFAAAVFLLVVFITRFVSLGSILAALSLTGSFFVFYNLKEHRDLFAFIVLIAIFVIVKHKSNIGRLIKGEESKIGEKKHQIST